MQSTVAEAIATRTRTRRRSAGAGEITDLRASAEDAPVIKLVNSILGQAVAEGASDIHFEPEDDEMRIRFRIDGVLQEAARVPEADGRRRDLPHQDHERARHRREARSPGRPRRGHGRGPAGRPARHHPADPARARGPRSGSSTRPPRCARSTTSAWRARQRSASRTPFRKPYGAVLVTGPTGAGKSTTLYAALQELNNVDKQHRHDRGPGRVPARGRQPDRRPPQGRAHLRHRACARCCARTPT